MGAIAGDDNQVRAGVDAGLGRLLDGVVARSGVHHACLAISNGDGSLRWSGAAGPAGPDGSPLRPETPYFIASVTKRFIATLVLQAHERGELRLADPIVAHLPAEQTDGLHVRDGVDHTADITVDHLLSHTSGLPDYWEKPRAGQSLYRHLAAGQDTTWTFDDVLRMAREERTPHFEPQDLAQRRQKARYSDTGFQLLIAILERVTGRSFDALLAERVLAPLVLERTWLPGRLAPPSSTAAPAAICAKDQPLDLPGMVASSNDLISTAGDQLRFHRALLAGELFNEPATAGLLTERANMLRNMFPIRYGRGTMVFRIGRLNAPGRRPVTLVGHSGVTGTWLFHCPALDVHLAGTVDQAKGQRMPFRLMARVLRVWHG